jgi:hypothetical protein
MCVTLDATVQYRLIKRSMKLLKCLFVLYPTAIMFGVKHANNLSLATTQILPILVMGLQNFTI